ncbi:MAG TPA: PQQ-binding-like beta-propeller repeat protein [Candidatus Sulfotelmatobacter sp.]|nr:PQQ-binding-like beta-propeller repeat protein [Candidatus Sulfotelmatobacter sp.]
MSDPVHGMKSPVWRAATAVGALALLITGAVTSAQTTGGYTAAQANSGATVYASRCAVCHGTSLQGGAGPTLVGAAFKKSINASYKTGADLLDFISKQMPADAPGTLSAQQYADVTAFVISKNGYPANSTTFSAANAGDLKLAGVTTSAAAMAAEPKVEIVRAAAPITKQFGPIPGGANVSVTDAMISRGWSSPADWLVNGRTWDNDRYSPLSQISTSNVRSLQLVAIAQTGFTASFETTPIVVGGVMYASTPVVNNQMKVVAMNAATGARIWETTYTLTPFKICCGPVNRGVTVAYGNVYFLTLDDRLVALDARTGALKWRVQVADPSVGYSETMTPQVYDGMILIGSAGGEWAIRGFDAAYNAHTGKQIWRWNATDPSTYSGDSWKSGGGMNWTTPALDPKLGLLIFSTGNPNPDLYGDKRKGDNRWSDSIVALDVHTGKMKWYYQEVKHDVWDYDAVSPVVLFDVHKNGRTIPAAGEAGKVGWFFIVDRRTGKLITRSQNYVAMSRNMFSQPTKTGVKMLPGANGGAEWSPPAFSPQTHDVYVLAMDQLMNFQTEPAVNTPGQLRLGSAFTNVAPGGLQDGRLVAINVDTGKVDWTHMTKQPLIGGALATAGGLVFYGEGDGTFAAVNARTGQVIWHYGLGAGVNAPPVSYSVGGKQYIAVAAGGNFQLGYPLGDTIAIFTLK